MTFNEIRFVFQGTYIVVSHFFFSSMDGWIEDSLHGGEDGVIVTEEHKGIFFVSK